MARHDALTLPQALLLLDIMIAIALQDVIYAKVGCMISSLIISRFATEPQLLTYVEIVATKAIDNILERHSHMLSAERDDTIAQVDSHKSAFNLFDHQMVHLYTIIVTCKCEAALQFEKFRKTFGTTDCSFYSGHLNLYCST